MPTSSPSMLTGRSLSGIYMGVSIVMGLPQKLDGLFHGKSENKVDDNWEYPYLRKLPHISG